MTNYLGIEVLEISPNARDPREDGLDRSVSALDPGLGTRSVRGRSEAPAISTPVVWTCPDRAAIASMEAFLDAHRGRAVPFWLPSRRRDLMLAQAVGASDSSILIQSAGYARHMFPAQARRHLAFLNGATWIYRSVLAAAEGGGVETLTLNAPLGVALPGGALISHLLLCRLASDEIEITYITESVAEVTLPCSELPQEVP